MAESAASLVLGIDGGASNTVALLAEAATGHVLGRGTGGPSNIQAVGEDGGLRELNHAVSAAFKAAAVCRAGRSRPRRSGWPASIWTERT